MAALIKNGKLCLEDGIVLADLLLDQGKMVYPVPRDYPTDTVVLDADGAYVLPGLIDIHTHLDDTIGSAYLADNYASGTRIAVENGITTLYNFITQSHDVTLMEAVLSAKEKAAGHCYCDVGWHLTPTRFDEETWNDVFRLIDQGFHTFKFYTTYREAGLFSDYSKIAAIAHRLKVYPLTLLVHCEDDALLASIDQSDFNLDDPFVHTLMRPPEAELRAVKEIIRIADETGVSFHVVHVSTPEAAELIVKARAERVPISCETGPQYLYLDEERLKGKNGHAFLCSPPLRSPSTRKRMVQLARDGAFDLFATDHCAFTKTDKDAHQGHVLKTPKGLPGLGALVPLIYDLYRDKGDAGMGEMTRCLSANPAKAVGLYPRKGSIQNSADGDIVILRESTVDRPIEATLSDAHQPYTDFTTGLAVEAVFIRGEQIVKKNALMNESKKAGELCQS
ncbi:amidohydrolase family protein [bacterium]|nr:amidohydrolase family protein [bacterium]